MKIFIKPNFEKQNAPQCTRRVCQVLADAGAELLMDREHQARMGYDFIRFGERQALLEQADYLVDGPFLLEQRDIELNFRGSANQRVIDLNKSRERGEIILYRSEYEDLW